MAFADLISCQGPVLLCILSCLESPRDVQAALYVCKAWSRMLSSGAVWNLALSRWNVSEVLLDRGAWPSPQQQLLLLSTSVKICCLTPWEAILRRNGNRAQGLASDLLLLSEIWQDLQLKPATAVAFHPVLLGHSMDIDPMQKPGQGELTQHPVAHWTPCLAANVIPAGSEAVVAGHSHSLIASMHRISQRLEPAQLDGNGLWKALCRMMHHLRLCRTFVGGPCASSLAAPRIVYGVTKHGHLIGMMMSSLREHHKNRGNWLLEHLKDWGRM